MEHYEVFDQYLQKSKAIENFCSERESAMCHTITMSLADQTKICYLTAIGRELDAVLDLINKMTEARKIKALGF
jgi:hypothetical protein